MFFMGVLEDVKCSRPDTWRTGSTLISWMTLFEPKEDILKFYIAIFIRSVSEGGPSNEVLGGC